MRALFLALILLGACAPSSGFRRIQDPSLPFERGGFVIRLPEQATWSVAEKYQSGRSFLTFAQNDVPAVQGTRIQPTTLIDITVIEDPAKFEKEFPEGDQHAALERIARAGAQPSSGRFKDLSTEFKWDTVQGQECARMIRIVEETRNPMDPSTVLINEARFTWLFHPTRPGACLRVLISHRAPKGQALVSVAKLEESFFSTLGFE